MTLSEFKAWFEGFSEIMDGPPNAEQWTRIQARVAEIDSSPTSYPVFVDRYVAPYRRWWETSPYFGYSGVFGGVGVGVGNGARLLSDATAAASAKSASAKSALSDPYRNAMLCAGRVEYASTLDA